MLGTTAFIDVDGQSNIDSFVIFSVNILQNLTFEAAEIVFPQDEKYFKKLHKYIRKNVILFKLVVFDNLMVFA